MSGKYGKIYKSIWDDPDFQNLTLEAQHLYVMLTSNKQTSFAGVIPLAPGRFEAMSKNMTLRKFTNALRELERSNYVFVDRKTLEICVRTYIKWDESLANKNLAVAVARSIEQIFSKKIRQNLAEELAAYRAEFPNLVGWNVLSEHNPAFFDLIFVHAKTHPAPESQGFTPEAPSEAPTGHPWEAPTEAPWQDPPIPIRFPMPS